MATSSCSTCSCSSTPSASSASSTCSTLTSSSSALKSARLPIAEDERRTLIKLLVSAGQDVDYIPVGGVLRDEITGDLSEDIDFIMPGRAIDSQQFWPHERLVDAVKLANQRTKNQYDFKLKMMGKPASYLHRSDLIVHRYQVTSTTHQFDIGIDVVRDGLYDGYDALIDFDVNSLLRDRHMIWVKGEGKIKGKSVPSEYELRCKRGAGTVAEIVKNCKARRFRILWTNSDSDIIAKTSTGQCTVNSKFAKLFNRLVKDHRLAKMLNRGWTPILEHTSSPSASTSSSSTLSSSPDKLTQMILEEANDSVKALYDDMKSGKQSFSNDQELHDALIHAKHLTLGGDGKPLLTVCDKQDTECQMCHLPLKERFVSRLVCCQKPIHSKCATDYFLSTHEDGVVQCGDCGGDPFGWNVDNRKGRLNR